jgi:uncharacterized protein
MQLYRQLLVSGFAAVMCFTCGPSADSQGISYGKWGTLTEVRQAAEQGNTEAQNMLSKAYYYGIEVQKSPEQGHYWLQQAATQGNLEAQDELGQKYMAQKDYQKALYWYKKAALQGDRGTQFELGCQYFDIDHRGLKKDYQQGLYWLKKAGEQGETGAQMALWAIYNDGISEEKNEQEALFWYNKAVKQKGQAELDFGIGSLYAGGIWVRKDFQKASYWFKRSAQLEYPEAQGMLGRMYRYGEGVPQDYVTAYVWFNLAASNQEEPWAKIIRDLRDNLSELMTPSQIEEGQRCARKWKPKPECLTDASKCSINADICY